MFTHPIVVVPLVATISHSLYINVNVNACARMANSGKSANVVSLHITPLTENNFSDWLIDIRAHLRSRKLWKYTQEPVPDEDEGETATATKKRKNWLVKTAGFGLG